MTVHNHPPYRPVCAERRLPDGTLRGACLPDVQPRTAGHCAQPVAEQCSSTQPCACGAELMAETVGAR